MREFVSPESSIEFGESVRHTQPKTIKPIFYCAGHKVYCGDSWLIMPHIEPIDLLFVDACYAIGARNRNNETILNDNNKLNLMEYLIPALRLLPYGNRGIFFFDMYKGLSILEKLPVSHRDMLFWLKNKSTAAKSWILSNTEVAFTFLNGKNCPDRPTKHIARGFQFDTLPGGSDRRLHRNAQKPLALNRHLINKASEPGDTILDFMAGSGSIAVAAHLEGRKSISIELEPEYCDIIIRRLEHVIATEEAIDDKSKLEAYEQGLIESKKNPTCKMPNCETCKTNRRRNAIRIK